MLSYYLFFALNKSINRKFCSPLHPTYVLLNNKVTWSPTRLQYVLAPSIAFTMLLVLKMKIASTNTAYKNIKQKNGLEKFSYLLITWAWIGILRLLLAVLIVQLRLLLAVLIVQLRLLLAVLQRSLQRKHIYNN